MLCTKSLVDVTLLFALIAFQHITDSGPSPDKSCFSECGFQTPTGFGPHSGILASSTGRSGTGTGVRPQRDNAERFPNRVTGKKFQTPLDCLVGIQPKNQARLRLSLPDLTKYNQFTLVFLTRHLLVLTVPNPAS